MEMINLISGSIVRLVLHCALFTCYNIWNFQGVHQLLQLEDQQPEDQQLQLVALQLHEETVELNALLVEVCSLPMLQIVMLLIQPAQIKG